MAEYKDVEPLKKQIADFKRAVNAVKPMSSDYLTGYISALSVVEGAIAEQPAADVVPVVRCKECKHYQNHPNGLCYLHTEPYGDGYKGDAVCVEPNGFCSYGKRKENRQWIENQQQKPCHSCLKNK